MPFVGQYPDTRRIVFVAYIDTTQGNLNGDPGAGNANRMDEHTGLGEISDVSIKRHIRDGWGRQDLPIFFDRGVPLRSKKMEIIREVAPGLDLSALDDEDDDAPEGDDETASAKGKRTKSAKKSPLTQEHVFAARDLACKKFIDLRAFGAVLGSNKKVVLPNVRGCVIVNFATSVDPIRIREHQIARTTTENDEVARGNASVNQTLGTKAITPYALYQLVVTLDVAQARANQFTDADYDLLIQQVLELYQYDASASRGSNCGLQALYAVHCTSKGVASYSTSQMLTHFRARRDMDIETPTRFSDYTIEVASDSFPADSHFETIRAPVYDRDLLFKAG